MSKKLLLVFLIFISNLHAFGMKWKTVEDIDLSESFMDEDNDCLFSVERFHLKNNCSLIIRPVLEYKNENQQTLRTNQFVYTQVYLQSDDTLLLILDNEDGVSLFHGAKKYLFRYENIDFDNYFCLARYDGAYYYYLFDKRNGKMLLRCLKCSVDLGNNIIMYLDESDELILYDLDSNKKYKIDKYIVYGKHGSNTYWEKFKVMDVTEYNYVISFCGNYDESGEEIPQIITVPKYMKIICPDSDFEKPVSKPIFHIEIYENDILMQTIEYSYQNTFMLEKHFDLVDVNFDGHDDIVILAGLTANRGQKYYDAYIWNPRQNKFILHDEIRNVINMKIDKERKLIYSSYMLNGWRTEYHAYSFVDDKLVEIDCMIQQEN